MTRQTRPTIEQAQTLGARRGDQATKDICALSPQFQEKERLLFEAWFESRSGLLRAVWNGQSYIAVDSPEPHFLSKANAAFTQELWLAWSDRAALSDIGLS